MTDRSDEPQGQEGPQEPTGAASEPEQPLIGPGGRWQPPPPVYEGVVANPDLLTRMGELVQVSVGAHRMGEMVDFMVSGSVIPQPDGNMVPVIGVTLAIPSHIVGQRVHGTGLIGDLWMTAEMVDQMVADMLEALRDSRSRAMNGFGPGSDFPG